MNRLFKYSFTVFTAASCLLFSSPLYAQKIINTSGQTNMVFFCIGGLFIVLLFTFFIYKEYKTRKKITDLSAKQCEELKHLKEKLLSQAEQLVLTTKEMENLSIVAGESDNAIVIFSAEGRPEWVNGGFTRLNGFDLEEFIRIVGDNLFEMKSVQGVRQLIEDCVKNKKSVSYSANITTKERKLWIQTTLTPILNSQGEIKKLIAIDADISKLKQAEQELLQQKEEIQAQAEQLELVNQLLRQQKKELQEQAVQVERTNRELEKLSIVARETDNSIVIAGKDSKIEWVNDGFTRLLGYSLEEFIKLRGINFIQASAHPNIRELLDQCTRTKKSVVYSSVNSTKEGNKIWVQTTLTPIFDENGDLIKLIAIDSDITKIKEAEKIIEHEKRKSDDLLRNILPFETAEELKNKGSATPRFYKCASILFTDFKGFTKACENLTPGELVENLHSYFIKFDEILEKHNIEKIKTIGDSYMCGGGIPVENNTHAVQIVLAGLEIQRYMNVLKVKKSALNQAAWELRLGIHTGEIIAGVVGMKKFAYDVWGDTVNIASRMESAGETGKVNISGATNEFIKEYFVCTFRGKIDAKNKGKIDMYFVDSIKPEYSIDGKGECPNEKFLSLICH